MTNNEDIRWKNSLFFIIFWIISQNYDQIIPCGIQGMEIHLWAYIYQKIFICEKVIPLIFKLATKLPVFDEHVLIRITWWNMSSGKEENVMLWKRKSVTINNSKAYISLRLRVSISKLLPSAFKKNLRFWHFLGFFFNFWSQSYGLWWHLCLLQSSIVFPA